MSLKHKETPMAVLILAALAAVVFGRVLFSSANLMTSDDNLGTVVLMHNVLPYTFAGSWADNGLLGLPGRINIGWTGILLYVLSPETFTNWNHLLALLCGSVVFFLFLTRRLGLHWVAGLLGAVTAYWLGSNMTLLYAGHIMKFGVICLAAGVLYLLPLAAGSFRWSILCGGLLGFMFLEQQDLALFFGLVWGAYACFLVFRQKVPWPMGGARLAALLAVALLVSVAGLMNAFEQNVAGVATMRESKQQRWDYCTQWSWPPEECVDFIAPGYTGWRSGEPDGPYWGRMGRSPGWETTRQGFMNFKLENTYLGVIPVALALFAAGAACVRRANRAEIFFWSAAVVVTLLLAFGKYFPLYGLFWHLPVVTDIRNPNKFLQVFQLCLGVLSAYGFDALVRGAREDYRTAD